MKKYIFLKTVLFLTLIVCLCLSEEVNISAKNIYLDTNIEKAASFKTERDSASNVWTVIDSELYKYSPDGLRKIADKDSGIIRIWCFDTLYALCKHKDIYTLETVEGGKLKILEKNSKIFNFFLTKNGKRITVNIDGEIKINGLIKERIQGKQSGVGRINVDSIMFSEEASGNVWIWATEKTAHESLFDKNIILIKNKNIHKIPCDKLGLIIVNDIFEISGAVYISQFVNDFKCAKINYSTNNDVLEFKKDAVFNENSFVPVLHHHSDDGKLWVLSMIDKLVYELFYVSESKFIKYATNVVENTFYPKDRQYFMLEDNGFVWMLKGEGRGVNLILPDGKLYSFDASQGVNLVNIKQILKLPDGNILLINDISNGLRPSTLFQILKKNAAKTLSSLKVEKYCAEFQNYGKVISDSKNNYYWDKRELRFGHKTLYKYDGKNTVKVVSAYDFWGQIGSVNAELKDSYFISFGIDSNDSIWLVFANMHVAILKSDGTYIIESIYKAYLDKYKDNNNFQLKLINGEMDLYFSAPDTLFIKGKPLPAKLTRMPSDAFREIITFTGKSPNIAKVFSKTDVRELFLEGFNKTSEGKTYITTLNNFSKKSYYVFDKDDWAKSYISELKSDPKLQIKEENKLSAKISNMFGAENIGQTIECKPEIVIFTLKSPGLFLKKRDSIHRLINIPWEFYSEDIDLSGTFIDVYDTLWISNNDTWIRIKKENIPNVLEEINMRDIKSGMYVKSKNRKRFGN